MTECGKCTELVIKGCHMIRDMSNKGIGIVVT